MAAVDSDVTPGTVGGAVVGRKKFEVIETIAIDTVHIILRK